MPSDPRASKALLAFAVLMFTFVPAMLAADEATSDTGLYIIHFNEPSLARYQGGIADLEATNIRVRGERKLDAKNEASVAYLDFLDQRQRQYVDDMEAALGRTVEVRYWYQAAINGVAAKIDEEEIHAIAALPGVKSVYRDQAFPMDTDVGPTWISADAIWDGTGTGGLPGTKGAGIVVGILDGGTNMDHPSYSDSPADGHTFVNPNGSGTFLGWCDPGHPSFSPTFLCNDKLIGGWDYADASWGNESDGPEDNGGHGSHTSSTAAGNTLVDPAISGVAPHANVIGYDVCGATGSCFTSDSIMATNQAILDGVDVINFSIGGGGSPWNDADSGFLDAVAAGIFVSASAGNSGPVAGSTGHIGPWVTTVGMSTHDRVNIVNNLESMTGGSSPPGDLSGASRTGGYGPAPIVYAGDFSNGDPNPDQCLNPFPGGTWSGEIVVCDRGGIARVMKCQNVFDGGAGGCVLANIAGGAATVVADPHILPSIHMDQASGDQVKAWLASGSGHMATISDGVLVRDPSVADIMSAGSSRGPASINVIKPNVTNPGVSIFAAVNNASVPGFNGPPFGLLSGTSMSSPHTAGCGALLMALHPSWTPMEIQSALMSTADTTVFKENGSTPADPFDMGGGRVDMSRAGRAGVVLDETEANFDAANPGLGGDPRTLNVASMQDNNCNGTCNFTRTLRKTTHGAGVSWTVSVDNPMGVNIGVSLTDNGADITMDVAIDVLDGSLPAAFTFGAITLVSDDPDVPDARFPVAIVPTGVSTSMIFSDGFESGDVTAWTSSTP